MTTAIITFSEPGAAVAATLAERIGPCVVYLHAGVHLAGGGGRAPCESPPPEHPVVRFERIAELAGELFATFRNLVFIAPAGLVVRAIAPHIRHKATDPAVVVVDVAGRWAISLLSGHEGGANELAMTVANALSAEPVITTTTDAARTVIVGVGCRRGASVDRIVDAVNEALARAGVSIEQVRLIASADVKRDEAGLMEAARRLGRPLRFVSSDEIRQSARNFARSDFVQSKVNLPAVAEPSALLAGRRTRLLLPRQTIHGVTVALAAEGCPRCPPSCSWSG